VREVLHSFYHYASHTSFDKLEGMLHFEPRTIAAPPPPSETRLRALVDAHYVRQSVVRAVNVEWIDSRFPYSADGSEAILRGLRRGTRVQFRINYWPSVSKTWEQH
jgi:hypothetical protein